MRKHPAMQQIAHVELRLYAMISETRWRVAQNIMDL